LAVHRGAQSPRLRTLAPTKAGIAIGSRLRKSLTTRGGDMTITCAAGITMAKLRVLAAGNQRLRSTCRTQRGHFGGVLATNMSGPHRYGFGTLRDYVIGITVVMMRGRK